MSRVVVYDELALLKKELKLLDKSAIVVDDKNKQRRIKDLKKWITLLMCPSG